MSDTPRTDEQALIDSVSYDGYSEDYASLLNFTRELERELNELKARHKTAILECTKYTPESWAAACEHEEPCAVWLDGPQMTQLMKDKEMLNWALSRAIVQYYPDADPEYLHRIESRADIDEAMGGAR
jgi:hypothetical protein